MPRFARGDQVQVVAGPKCCNVEPDIGKVFCVVYVGKSNAGDVCTVCNSSELGAVAVFRDDEYSYAEHQLIKLLGEDEVKAFDKENEDDEYKERRAEVLVVQRQLESQS